MEWIRTHPYAAGLGAACLLIVAGTILVIGRLGAPAKADVSAWNGNAAQLGATTASATPAGNGTVPPPAAQENYGTATLPYTQNTPVSDSEGTLDTAGGASSFDFNALLAELSHQSAGVSASSGAGSSTSGQSPINSWGLIPAGLISTTSPVAARSALQQSLYAYGNEVGSLIQGYDAAHRDQAQVLGDASNDRENSIKQAALEKVGQDLESVGAGIAEITDTPSEAASDSATLSASYIDIGKKLIALAQALPGSDSGLVTAIETYDTGVGAFTRDYVALANLFSSYGVIFGSADPGSVFSFNSNAL